MAVRLNQTGVSTSSVQIRQATRPDLPVLSELLVCEFQLYPSGCEWLMPFSRLSIQADLLQRLTIPNYRCLVAITATEAIVGSVEIGYRTPRPWPSHQAAYPYLSNLVVRSTHRQQGIAKQLLAAAEQQVQHWQRRQVYLHVMTNNFVARQLYLKAGYVTHHACHQWINGSGSASRLFLYKQLGNPNVIKAPQYQNA